MGQLLDVLGAGGGKADGRGEAGRRHDEAQQQRPRRAHQPPDDEHQQSRPIVEGVGGQTPLPGDGSAQIREPAVDHEQSEGCHQPRQAHQPKLLLGAGDARLPHGGQGDHGKEQRAQHVHGLVPGLQAQLHGRHSGGAGGHLAQRPNDADADEHQQRHEHGGGEDLADDVHHLAGAEAQDQHQAEIDAAGDPGGPAGEGRAQKGLHGDVEGGGGGPGDGDEGTDAQGVEEDQQKGGGLVQLDGDAVLEALLTAEEGEQRQDGQTRVRQDVHQEADHPVGAGDDAQRRGEDQVARAEEHGEQGETEDEYLAEGELVVHGLPP